MPAAQLEQVNRSSLASSPGAHETHDACPVNVCMKPKGQYEQFLFPPVENLPASHVPEQLNAPKEPSNCPGGQSMHDLLPEFGCTVP